MLNTSGQMGHTAPARRTAHVVCIKERSRLIKRAERPDRSDIHEFESTGFERLGSDDRYA